MMMMMMMMTMDDDVMMMLMINMIILTIKIMNGKCNKVYLQIGGLFVHPCRRLRSP
jgi:hypothetical protein